ncbi:MAG TPA: undecaprenyl-diphosphate phosphatase [bacterium]|nr:undecaprenyl-diphosphate phosphatase [bacterium]
MELVRYAALGLVQGLTEFLPVSSSGHLVLAQRYLGVEAPGIVLEVALHVATALAIVIYFRRRLVTIFAASAGGKRGWLRFAALIVVASIPAAVVGLGFEDNIELLFESNRLVGGALLFTAAVLITSTFLRRGDAKLAEMSVVAAVVVGLGQALAIAPGVSRSGMTIVAGLALGLAGAEAATFSFLLSVPAILGAAALEAGKIGTFDGSWLALALAFVIAFAAGLAAIHVVLASVRGRRFGWFGAYCAVVGLAALLL